MGDPIGGVANVIEIAGAVVAAWVHRQRILGPPKHVGGHVVRRVKGLKVVREWGSMPGWGKVALVAFIVNGLLVIGWASPITPTEPPDALAVYPGMVTVLGYVYAVAAVARWTSRRLRRCQ